LKPSCDVPVSPFVVTFMLRPTVDCLSVEPLHDALTWHVVTVAGQPETSMCPPPLFATVTVAPELEPCAIVSVPASNEPSDRPQIDSVPGSVPFIWNVPYGPAAPQGLAEPELLDAAPSVPDEPLPPVDVLLVVELLLHPAIASAARRIVVRVESRRSIAAMLLASQGGRRASKVGPLST
jgi:hypothetical protein